MTREIENLEGLSWDQYTEAEMIFALTDERNFAETYGNMENVGKDTVRNNPDTLISNYYKMNGKRITPAEAKDILAKYNFLDILKKYNLA